MLKQCAGCGKVFDDESGNPDVSPRPYGCCEECNAHTFRSNAEKEVLPPPPPDSGLVPPEIPQAPVEGLDKALAEEDHESLDAA